jgi:hypothetical protein
MSSEGFDGHIRGIVNKFYLGDKLGRKQLIRKRKDELAVHKKKERTFFSLLKTSFPRCPIVDWTSIRSYTSYEYRILLNKNIDSVMDDDIDLITYLGGNRKDLHIYFSYLANYWHWHVVDTSFLSGEWSFKTTFTIPEEFASNINILRIKVEELGFVELNEANVKKYIEGADVPLIKKSKTTVFNVLFSDTLDILEQ